MVEELGFDSTKLVWTEEERLNYSNWVSKMGYPVLGEPLLEVKVDASTELMVEEELEYDGVLTKFIVRFARGHCGLVGVRPSLNDVLLLPDAISGDDNVFGVEEASPFKNGDRAKVEIKNFDAQHEHVAAMRFFTTEVRT